MTSVPRQKSDLNAQIVQIIVGLFLSAKQRGDKLVQHHEIIKATGWPLAKLQSGPIPKAICILRDEHRLVVDRAENRNGYPIREDAEVIKPASKGLRTILQVSKRVVGQVATVDLLRLRIEDRTRMQLIGQTAALSAQMSASATRKNSAGLKVANQVHNLPPDRQGQSIKNGLLDLFRKRRS
jgi:transcriptional regulator of nitric oxide reductase